MNPMDQEEVPCEVKKASLEATTPIENVPDSISPFDSDSSLSEEEMVITQRDSDTGGGGGIITLSPLCNQYNDKTKIDSSSLLDCVLLSDEEIIESIYQSLLRVILSLQIQQGNAEVWCFDGCKTPPSRHTEMVPDTCPGAPMKLTKISRNIDSGLRRKLF